MTKLFDFNVVLKWDGNIIGRLEILGWVFGSLKNAGTVLIYGYY
jgi:hypothetical protein